MNSHEFRRHLKKDQLRNAYFLAGPEDYLLDDCLRELTQKIIDPATREFNYDMFYAGQAEIGRIIETANAYPMLADRRLVIVRDFEKMSPLGTEVILKYLKNPAPTTVLVLISAQLAGRGKGILKLKAGCCLAEFKPLYDNQIAAWIKEHVKTTDYKISDEAVLLLHAHVGNNLRALVNELEKIFLNHSQEDKKIETADVQKVVGLSRKYTVFNLMDAVGNRDVSKSLLILSNMLESGESHTSIVANVARHFENLLKIKGGVASGKSQSELSRMTGIPSFFLSKNREMAGKYSFEEFSGIFKSLLTTDLFLKTSRQAPKIALETMLLKILR